jgi:triose/dihydroxyacetone kinase / FAD-AMP lyase (cyclizing)
MLDAAVCGNIFASPNAKQIEAGLNLIQSPRGTLVITKNYTGDKLNFTLAVEKFRFATAQPVRLVVVSDDVSIGRTKSARVGRRGLAGTVLVHKIAGGAAAAGRSLDEIMTMAQFAIDNMGTIGVALDGCCVPGQNARHTRLAPDEIEIGIGIHNEPGSKRISPVPALGTLVTDMLAMILDEEDEERNYLASHPRPGQSDVVLLVNNIGGLSTLEIAGITGEVCSQLSKNYQVQLARVYAGTFLSALNGPGFSITILNLPTSEPMSSDILEYLDMHTDAFGWSPSLSADTWTTKAPSLPSKPLTPPLSPGSETIPHIHVPNITCELIELRHYLNGLD